MGFLRVSVIVVLTAVVVKILPGLISRPAPLEVLGSTEKGWEPVAEVFKEIMSEHPTSGYAYSVYHEGKKVVDLYGGYADYSVLEPFRENTLSILFSATKGLCALPVAQLVERGLLDYKKPVSLYWPEFAANGKEGITVDTLLSHQAGLYTTSGGWSMFDSVDNPEKLSKQLAEQKPLWEPGTKHGYHGFNICLYINELVKRVDPKHRLLHQFLHEEFFKPLDLDMHIGLPLSENYRAAKSEFSVDSMEDWKALLVDTDWPFMLNFGNKFYQSLEDIKEPTDVFSKLNNPRVRQVPNASFNGFTTARDAAKLMGVIANGGTYRGKTYLSPKTTRLLTEVLAEGIDEVVNAHRRYGRCTSVMKSPLGSELFGTPGTGGQMAYGDLEHKLGLGFVTTKLYLGATIVSPTFTRLFDATYEVLKNIKK